VDISGIAEKAKKCAFLIDEKKFDELIVDAGYADSFVYLFAVSLILLVFNLIVGVVRAQMAPSNVILSAAEMLLAVLVGVVLGWILNFVFLYLWAGFCHLLLKLLGGKAPLLKTVQVFIYGGTPSYLFSWIPLIGLLAYLLSLANVTIGIKRVHNISLLKAVLVTIIIPAAIICVIVVLAVMYFTASMTSLTTSLPVSS